MSCGVSQRVRQPSQEARQKKSEKALADMFAAGHDAGLTPAQVANIYSGGLRGARRGLEARRAKRRERFVRWALPLVLLVLALVAVVFAAPSHAVLYSANTRDAPIAAMADIVTWHVNACHPIGQQKTFNKPFIIEDDGTMGCGYPEMVNRWGASATEYRRLFEFAEANGYGSNHLATTAWRCSWSGERNLRSSWNCGFRNPKLPNGDLHFVAEAHVLSRSRFFGRNPPVHGSLELRGGRVLYGGQQITFAGYSNYGLVADPNIVLEVEPSPPDGSWLDIVHHIGGNLVRVFGWDAFSYYRFISPNQPKALAPWVVRGGKFDLLTFDQRYFDRLRNAIDAADNRGIVFHFSVFDRFQQEMLTGAAELYGYRYSPYNPRNNVQGWGNPTVAPGQYPVSFMDVGGQLWPAHQAYIRKVAATIRATAGGGRNVVLEIVNEDAFWRGISLNTKVNFYAEVIALFRSEFAGHGSPPGSPIPPDGSPVPTASISAEVAQALRQIEAARRNLARDKVKPRHLRRSNRRLKAATEAVTRAVELQGGGP